MFTQRKNCWPGFQSNNFQLESTPNQKNNGHTQTDAQRPMTLLSPLKLDTEESETKVMRQSFKSMPDRSSHMSFLHDGKRDWASIKHFWSALISQNQIASPPNNLTCSDDDFSISSPLSLPQWVIGCGEYGVTDIEAIHDCAKEELLGYHARGDKKKGNKRKTFGLR